MSIEHITQTLKTLSDDTRLRILNLVKNKPMTVKDLCLILGKSQPVVSKHLLRLRLSGILQDKRRGQFVFYCIFYGKNSPQDSLVKSILAHLESIDTFKKDLEFLKEKENELKISRLDVGVKEKSKEEAV